MTNFEIDNVRETTITFSNLKGIDTKYNFYYDETNNIRKFYLKEDDFNESSKSNFLLGGIVDEKFTVDFQECFNLLGLQDNVTEVKLKHIASGDFLSCLKSKRLRIFLDFLQKKDIYIHYSNLNFLYFSIVDIVDSAETEDLSVQKNRQLKDILYQIVKSEKEKIIKLFYVFEYPNIKVDSLKKFLHELIKILKPYEEEYGANLSELIEMLIKAGEAGRMPFIMDEENFQLIENFLHFYIRTIYLFTNSSHIYDREVTIEELLKDFNIIYKGEQLANYSFQDSKDNKFLQASDIFIGLLGKYFDFLSSASIPEIKAVLKNLDDIQFSNLELLVEIIAKTNRKNPAFIHRVCSNDDMRKDYLIERYFN